MTILKQLIENMIGDYLKEENISSGRTEHALADKAEMNDHADYMQKKHGVTTKFHRNDGLSYHGPKANVKKAILTHYDGDHEHAKENHPRLFKES